MTYKRPAGMSNVEWFLSKVEVTESCWIWRGYVDPFTGYGRFLDHVTGERWAHRASHRLFKGDIPEGMHIDHLCVTRPCVNPDHLEVVTQAENTRRVFARRPERPHGAQKHQREGCRCDACMTGARDRFNAGVARRRAEAAEGRRDFKHGENGYRRYDCRCSVCIDGHEAHKAEALRKWRERKGQAA